MWSRWISILATCRMNSPCENGIRIIPHIMPVQFLTLGTIVALFMTLANATNAQSPGSKGGERRIALVIGNNDYKYVTSLGNALADARAMKRELESRGFQVVYRENVMRHDMNDAIEEFLGKLST